MIRELYHLKGVFLSYKGTPSSIKVFTDGDLKQTINDVAENTFHTTRRISFDQGLAGYINQISVDHNDQVDYRLDVEPFARFSEQRLWHYYEVTYNEEINVDTYLDELRLNASAYTLTLPNIDETTFPKAKKKHHTKKVYLPPLSYGRVPHVKNNPNDTGSIISMTPIAVPARFYTRVQTIDEVQVTFTGEVFVKFFIDGDQIGDIVHLTTDFNRQGKGLYTTEKFYLAEGATGLVFQWEQCAGTGEIASVETNASLADLETASVPTPV